MPTKYHLSTVNEKSHYNFHENDPADMRYRQFLGRLFNPVTKRIATGSHGLDFGSGPGPTLSVMFEEEGHSVRIYDPFYADDLNVFNERYDFITASEVAEHLRQPNREFKRLWRCLRPGGILGVMTQFLTGDTPFATWYYITDPTHICFYSAKTFQWLAEFWQAELEFPSENVAIFSKAQDD
ncbi:MAG: class I SAM-dependent methyltransferase [Planctomycetaceae bacterium]